MTFVIQRIALREIHLPLVEPFQSAHGTVAARRVLLLELADGEGHTAWSECVAESRPGYSADTVDGSWLALTEWIGAAVLGRPVASAAAIDAMVDRQVRGHHMARAALEMGAWALQATRDALPLASLLCSAVGATPRPFVETGLALGYQLSPDALAERVRTAVAEGYRRIKVKIEPGRDLAWLGAARTGAGHGVALAVDANGSYSLDDGAHLRALRAMDELGLSMIEQPLAHDDLVRHAELQAQLRTPLCLDESVTGVGAASSMIALRSARILNLKPGRVGGFQASLDIHARCVAARVTLWCGGMLESGIGRAYNVALASLPGFTEPGDLSPSARYWSRDVVTRPWTMTPHGQVAVPLDRPALGVDVDIDFVDELTVRATTLRAR